MDQPRRIMAFVDKRHEGIKVTADGDPILPVSGRASGPAITVEMVENASDATLDALAERLWLRIQHRMLAPHRSHG